MKNEETTNCCKKGTISNKHHHYGGSNTIYSLGVVGALFYFLQGTSTFGAVMLGIGKALVWPALLMFQLLTYLKM